MTGTITPQDFSEIRWRGHWIWTEGPGPMQMFAEMNPQELNRPEAHGLFRKTFSLARVPARVPARITADSRYILYVNGHEVTHGPLRGQPRRLHYDLFDLAPFLKVGENLLAVHVRYYGKANSFWMPAVPNGTLGKNGVMVFECDLSAACYGDAGWLLSDASWKCLKCDAWANPEASGGPVGGGVPLEIVDARRLPSGWQATGFDDAVWVSAALFPAMHIGGFARTTPPTDPYGPLYPRPIAALGGEVCLPATIGMDEFQAPLSLDASEAGKAVMSSLPGQPSRQQSGVKLPLEFELSTGGAARLLMDMGRIVTGFPIFELSAPAGTVFDFMYAEEPLSGKPQFGGLGSTTRYTARGADDRFRVYDAYGMRYIYLLVHGASGKVALNHFAIKEDLYPWQSGASFKCSDEALNRVYQACIRTVALNSRDSFTDCPTREQRAWVGDSVVHQMVHLATNPDWRLAWHYLTLGNSPRYDGILPMSVAGEIEATGGVTIPDWSLHWVHGVYNLYRFTGDWERVKAFMPSVERVLRWYQPFQAANGQLKDLVEWNLVDWASISTLDTTGVISALWARGLREFSEMAVWLEEKSSQRWADGVYAKIKAGFEIFWDEARGSYVDHVVEGKQMPEMTQLGGALAILADLAPKERWSRIIATITDPASLVVKSWIGGAGDYSTERMEKQLHGIYEPDWIVHQQVVKVEPFISYTVHDAVAKAGFAGRLPELCRSWLVFLTGGYDTIGENWGWGTHVHGWSCTPTKDLVFYVLGITPAQPGYTVARIAPRLGDLAWVEGTAPTPHGLIHVRAEKDKVMVNSPVPVIIDLPGRAPQSLPAGAHEVKL